jgi:ribose 5-phosphate isomerase RpiB
MRIAVVNETSAADKNADIISALDGRGHTIINAGMTKTGASPEMTYIHTGLLSALLLELKRVDLIVGGCGTGQGYLNSVMQYPGVFCGLITSPLDAWLFGQINGGNCLALALNFEYGWAGDVNLRFIFDRFFSVETGCGYPAHRKESQEQSRNTLTTIASTTHKSFAEIISGLEDAVLRPVLSYPGVTDLIDAGSIDDSGLKEALAKRLT